MMHRRFAATAAALALFAPNVADAAPEPVAPAPAPTAAPAPAPAEPAAPAPERPPIATDRDAPAPGWDDEPTPAPAPTPTPAPPVAVSPDDLPPPPPRSMPSEASRRVGNGLWIGAGVTAGLATVLNGFRAHIASGPCQTANNQGGSCEIGWNLITPWTWGLNLASIGMAGAGGKMRGRYDAAADPSRHDIRRPILVALGSTLLGVGVLTNVTVRALWLSDWASPEEEEIFDFAHRGHAFAYYGTMQLTSIMTAVGLAALVYGTARPPRTARRGRTIVMPSGTGVQIVGRF